jgi:hypothetical protein
MAVVITLCTLVLLALVVLVVSAPLRAEAERRAGGGQAEAGGEEGAIEDGEDGGGSRADERERLEAARETKYREIRDAELDYRTGKLSERDYRELDAELRGEALEILDALEAAGATPTDASEARSRSRRTGPRRRPSSG